VNVVDSHTLFMQEKDRGYELFGSSGTHWNKYGAYLVWKEIVKSVEGRFQPPLQLPYLSDIVRRPSDEIDADLGALLNLWDSSLSSPMTYYPVFNLQEGKQQAKKPSVLLVGDSFLFTLVDIIKRANLSADVDAWYYFKRHFHYPVYDGKLKELTSAVETQMRKDSVEWQDQFFNKDLVILVQTQHWLPDVGFGFVTGALKAIENKTVTTMQD
jgi:hypothetical protein